jgi:hypothetical protein
MTAGLVQHEIHTATNTLMIALALDDGGQNESAIIDPANATAKNSDLKKSMLSFIGSLTVPTPNAT